MINLNNNLKVLKLYKNVLKVHKETLSKDEYKFEKENLYEQFNKKKFNKKKFQMAQNLLKNINPMRILGYPKPTKEFWTQYYSKNTKNIIQEWYCNPRFLLPYINN